MRSLSLVAVLVFIWMTAIGLNLQTRKGNNLPLSEGRSFSKTGQGDETLPLPPATHRYRLDPSQSKFSAHAHAGGLLWFKGQDHIIAIRDFTGEAQLTAGSINPASLQVNAKAASMVETSDVFTEREKQIINRELREIVLHPDQYPEIIFRSTSITGRATSRNQYELKVTGDLTLHGVTRQITIPTTVTLTGNSLRARGEFAIKRSDFKVKATSAMHGLIRVKDKVKFTYDIVGQEQN